MRSILVSISLLEVTLSLNPKGYRLTSLFMWNSSKVLSPREDWGIKQIYCFQNSYLCHFDIEDQPVHRSCLSSLWREVPRSVVHIFECQGHWSGTMLIELWLWKMKNTQTEEIFTCCGIHVYSTCIIAWLCRTTCVIQVFIIYMCRNIGVIQV